MKHLALKHPEAIRDFKAKMSEIYSDLYSVPAKSVCPIFQYSSSNSLNAFGSGALISIGNTKFLLTAAHVTDVHGEYELLVPGEQNLISLSGYLASLKLPKTGNRADDRYDISYFKLNDDTAASLATHFHFLTYPEVDLTDRTNEKDMYVMMGYPASRTKIEGGTIDGPYSTMTGSAAPERFYNDLGYNIQDHILIKFRRNKSVDLHTGTLKIMSKPDGMSGGGVFAFPKNPGMEQALQPPKLVGILMKYYPHHHLFVATRLNCFVNCIFKNHPELPISKGGRFDHGSSFRKTLEN
jgi:hypothetical protein